MLNDSSAELLLWLLLLLNPITKHFNVIAENLSTKLRVNPHRSNNAGRKEKKNQFQRILVSISAHITVSRKISRNFPPLLSLLNNDGKKIHEVYLLNNLVYSTFFLTVNTVSYNRCLGFFHPPNCNFIPLNNNSSFPSPLSPGQPLLPAFYVSTLFRSQLRGCVITIQICLFLCNSPLAGLPQHRTTHSTSSSTFTLFLDVPYVSFINSHSLKCLFHGLQLVLHKQNSTELCDSHYIGRRERVK